MNDAGAGRPAGRAFVIALCLVAVVNVVLLAAGGYSLTRRIDRNAQLAQVADDQRAVRLTNLEDSLRAMEPAVSEMESHLWALNDAVKSPLPSPVSVADRQAALDLIEQSLPTVRDDIIVRRLPDDFEFRFELKNTSGVVLDCTTPQVTMTRDDFPADEDTLNEVEGKEAGEVGLLAPGAVYNTTWSTGELNAQTWMNFTGTCQPLAVRRREVEALAAAGVGLTDVAFEAIYGKGWTSSDTTR